MSAVEIGLPQLQHLKHLELVMVIAEDTSLLYFVKLTKECPLLSQCVVQILHFFIICKPYTKYELLVRCVRFFPITQILKYSLLSRIWEVVLSREDFLISTRLLFLKKHLNENNALFLTSSYVLDVSTTT